MLRAVSLMFSDEETRRLWSKRDSGARADVKSGDRVLIVANKFNREEVGVYGKGHASTDGFRPTRQAIIRWCVHLFGRGEDEHRSTGVKLIMSCLINLDSSEDRRSDNPRALLLRFF